jgi:hypothetical protein
MKSTTVLVQNPLSDLNNPTVLFLRMANVSSKKWMQLLLHPELPLRFQQLATMRMSLTKANKG